MNKSEQIVFDGEEQPAQEEVHKLSNFFSPCGTFLTMHVDGPVTDTSLNLVIDNIVLANTHVGTKGESGFEKVKHINIFVSSEGGDLGACCRLLTAMDASAIPIRTIGWGEAASAGLMILMGGHERLISNNTLLMSHYASFIQSGIHQTHTMDRSQTNMASTIATLMNEIYARYTGKQMAYIKKHLLKNRDDVYLTPTQAIRHGVVDGLFTGFKDLNKAPVRKK